MKAIVKRLLILISVFCLTMVSFVFADNYKMVAERIEGEERIVTYDNGTENNYSIDDAYVVKEEGLGQTDLVKELQLLDIGITRETLVKIERGIQHIQLAQLKGIKQILDVSYEDLLV